MFKPNELISDIFVEENLVTGLTAPDFDVTLLHDGVLSVIPVTITELAGKPGFYRIEFTPDDTGRWSIDIIRTGNNKVRYQSAYQVQVISAEILDEIVANHLSPGTVGDYLNRAKKYTANRVVLDPVLNTYTVKEDDGVTDFESGTSTPTERTPE